MGVEQYRGVLAVRDVRRILLLGLVVRVPVWAGSVVLTLHVVTHLHRSYAAAGLLTGVVTIALALSGPWRGRRLDTVGLRATLTPSLLVLTACWCVAPFLSYWPLLVLATLAGAFEIPTFSVVRQTLIRSVSDDLRKTALSIDSVAIEISFMIGPVLGVLLATYISTPWAMLACELTSVLGGALMWFVNPPIEAQGPDQAASVSGPARRTRLGRLLPTWLSPGVVAIFAASAGTVLVLSGTDVGIVAALRHFGHQPSIGWVLAVWGLGSALGGIVYGALHRSVPAFALLALLSATTVPVALAGGQFSIAALLFVTGLFCAPAITATVDALTRVVPASVRGEALGWHGSALLVGSSAGAPVAGVAVDAMGWQGGFLWCGGIGLAIALGGWLVLVLTRRPVTEAAGHDDPLVERGTEPSVDEVVAAVGVGGPAAGIATELQTVPSAATAEHEQASGGVTS